MIKHNQIYERHSVVSIEDGLAAIKTNIELVANRKKPIKVTVNGQPINTKSLRLMTFFHDGLTCRCCKRIGTHFALERNNASTTAYHLNLWSTDENGDEYLMTHDHILARSLGGVDNLSNTQTMCSPCNAEKGWKEAEILNSQK